MSQEEKNLLDLAVIFMNGNHDERAAVASLLLEALEKTQGVAESESGENYPALVDGFAIKYQNKRIGIEITVYLMPESDN